MSWCHKLLCWLLRPLLRVMCQLWEWVGGRSSSRAKPVGLLRISSDTGTSGGASPLREGGGVTSSAPPSAGHRGTPVLNLERTTLNVCDSRAKMWRCASFYLFIRDPASAGRVSGPVCVSHHLQSVSTWLRRVHHRSVEIAALEILPLVVLRGQHVRRIRPSVYVFNPS